MMEQDILFVSTGNLLNDAKTIIDRARAKAYAAVNVALVERNWLLGKRIAEEELQGEHRAEYGASVIKRLSNELTDVLVSFQNTVAGRRFICPR